MKYDIEQMLSAAASVKPDRAGLRTAEEAAAEFRRRVEIEKNVPYWGYFFKSAAIIAIGFGLLFFICSAAGSADSVEIGPAFRERMKLLASCSINYGE